MIFLQLREYIIENDKNFKEFTPESEKLAIRLLETKNEISRKNFYKWFAKTIGGIAHQTRKEFWLRRGYSLEETKAIITKIQATNSKKRFDKLVILKEKGDMSWKKQFNMNPEYYEARGASKDEAEKIARERQVTFSLQKCIAKYGLQEGIQIFSKRQEKWLNTLNSKSDQEKLDIYRRRVVPLGQASQQSLAIFKPLHKMLVENGVCDDSEIYYGFEKRREWFLGDTDNFYLYDFCVPKLKLIIEFQGCMFHPDYRLNEEQMKSWKSLYNNADANVIRLADEKKRVFAEKHGFKVFYIWSSDDQQQQMKDAYDAVINVITTTTFDVRIKNIQQLLKTSSVAITTPVGLSKISEFHVKENKKLFDIFFVGGTTLRCSSDHFVMLSTGEWVDVNNLSIVIKDTCVEIKTDEGNKKIFAIVPVGVGIVHDITVENDEHFYYANGIVSHNSGKTLLALAAGLKLLSEKKYNKIIVTRPIQPLGKDIGFLPGTMEEKMEPWIAPIKDNIAFLTCAKSAKNNAKLDLMLKKGELEIEAITYIRGRSIPNAYIIVDECQNITLHELKTILTRVGEGSKVVCTGDSSQIDNVNVDMFSNGLSHVIEKFKDQAMAAHITLLKGERSALASLSANIL